MENKTTISFQPLYGDLHSEQIIELDEISDQNVYDSITDTIDGLAFAYGLFYGDCLIGYCSLNYADDCDFEDIPEWTDNSRYLTNVFIKEEYRNNGYGLQLIEKCLAELNTPKETVFLSLLNETDQTFFEKVGFIPIVDGYTMLLQK